MLEKLLSSMLTIYDGVFLSNYLEASREFLLQADKPGRRPEGPPRAIHPAAGITCLLFRSERSH